MKLVVGVNHAAPFHIGGSEKVVQQITESMTNDYGMDCCVLTYFATKFIEHNGVKIIPINKDPEGFIRQLNGLKPDHYMVYSDSFLQWETTLRRAETINCSKSIAMVGMNHMRSKNDLGRLMRKKKDYFRVITHSDNYLDYQACQSFDIPVTVIPNAINLEELKDQSFSFRKKYRIPNKPMILCVSNFYPGKGQSHLLHILKNLKAKGQDFVAVFICTTVNFSPANALMHNHLHALKKTSFMNKLLIDIPRKDTIQAFLEADIFVFPSEVEVAPLVPMEAMACKLPWVSLNVGNMEQLDGGFVVQGEKKVGGRLRYTSGMYKSFTQHLYDLLTDESLRKQKGEEGYQQILSDFNWENTKSMYYDVFTSSHDKENNGAVS